VGTKDYVRPTDIKSTVNRALDYAKSNPCCICSYEGICGIKYKGVCKVARQIRIKLTIAREAEK